MRHFWICSALVLLSCPSAYTQQRSASSFVAPDRGKEDANEAPVKVRATFMAAERTPVTDWRANEIIVRESESQARVESIACGVDELLTIGILLQINGRDSMTRNDLKWNKEHYTGLLTFVRSLPSPHRAMFVSAFDETTHKIVPMTTDPNSISVDDVIGKIEAIRPTHYVNSNDAMQRVLTSEFAGRPGRKILIALGDFLTTDSTPSVDELARIAIQSGVEVFQLMDSNITEYGFSKLLESNFRLLPAATGGAAYELSGSSFSTPLPLALEDLKKLLSSSCVITYQPKEHATSGLTVPLQVRVTRNVEVEIYSPASRLATTLRENK